MLWLTHHNPKIDWKTGEVKITRCLEEYGSVKSWKYRRFKIRRKKQ